MRYIICDGAFDGVFDASDDQAAMVEARRWLADAVLDTDCFGEWTLAEGEEGEHSADFCRLDDDDDEIVGEVTVKVRMEGGRVVETRFLCFGSRRGTS